MLGALAEGGDGEEEGEDSQTDRFAEVLPLKQALPDTCPSAFLGGEAQCRCPEFPFIVVCRRSKRAHLT